jgi:L-gulono-1,4-lactone dehydrogenase
MNPRLLEISKTRYTWSNATNNVVTNPLRYFYPENAEDIRAIIAEAEQEKLRVRAVGSGHSFSEAAKGDDFLMDMKEMRNVSTYESPYVKPAHANQHFILADAGTTIRRTNRILERMGLALMNMGAVDFQTLSGALMTGTHGTGIKKPAFPDMIRSIRMVGRNSELLHIEPANGITDPVYHQQQHPFVKLIQDDDIFYSCVLSFGAMGIVYQLVMEVVPAFWIHEHRYLEKWSALKTQLLNGTFMNKVAQHDFVAFRVNPHKIKGDHLCSIVQQNIVPKPPDGKRQGRRNRFFAFLGNMEGGLESFIKTINRNSKARIANRIQLSTKLSAVKSYTDKSYKVLYQSGAAVLRYGISSEFAFQADGAKLVNVLENIFKYTDFLSNYADRHHPSHIPVRFVMPSKVYLSSCYNRPTMYVDVPTLHNTIGDFELLEHYQKEMICMGGIPHWGKVNNMLYANNAFIKNSYPKWQTWFNVRQQMDPDCTFINDFILKMGLGTCNDCED